MSTEVCSPQQAEKPTFRPSDAMPVCQDLTSFLCLKCAQCVHCPVCNSYARTGNVLKCGYKLVPVPNWLQRCDFPF
jgi:hypothetical protein